MHDEPGAASAAADHDGAGSPHLENARSADGPNSIDSQTVHETDPLSDSIGASFLRALPVIEFTSCPDGRLLHVAGSGLERISRSATELIGSPLDDLFPDAAEHIAEASTTRFVAHGTGPNGPWWFDTFIGPDPHGPDPHGPDPHGPDPHGPSALTGFAIDVTERMQTRQALREERDHLAQLAEQAADALFLHDLDGRLVDVNRRACESLGMPREALLARSVLDVVDGPSDEQLRAVWNGLVPGETRAVRGNHRRADGTSFPVEASVGLVHHGGRKLVLASVRDMTEREEAEAQRRRLEDKMRHSQKLESLGILAGGIAHDFNNLLTGVIGNVTLALEDVSHDSPLRPTLEQVEHAASRAADLARQMLAYSGRGRFVLRKLQLSQLVESVAQALANTALADAHLEIELATGLPPVEGDRAQVTQVVLNLMTNAAEAVRDTNGHIRIRTGFVDASKTDLAETYIDDDLPAGRYVFLEVRDEGCGMDPETCARLFDPFFTTKETGRGLGLAAALGIVRGHRGAIRVASEVDAGTTIRMLLPAAVGDAASDPAAPAGLDRWRHAGQVLVVDDESTVREIVQTVLKRRGLTVHLAENGLEGVEAVKRLGDDLDLVLLDLTMPILSGDEALVHIHEHAPHIPVVLMSGFPEQDVQRRLDPLQPVGFLHKPFRPEGLVRLVRSLLAPNPDQGTTRPGRTEPVRTGRGTTAARPGA